MVLRVLGAKTTKSSWRWVNLMFIYEKTIESKLYDGLFVKLRRVSLGQRLKFLAEHSAELAQLNFIAASINDGMTESRILAEVKVCKDLLSLCVVDLSGAPQGGEEIAAWLIDSAPQDLCMELIRFVLDEFLLSGERSKN